MNYAKDKFGVEALDLTKGIDLLPEDVKAQDIPTEEEINKVLSTCNSAQ